MSSYKIIFSGPVNAGKTTAIRSISDIPPVTTEAKASDDVGQLKSSTTVAMDYGMIKLDNGDAVHLYGTPGQERFDFMWEILTQGGIGLILLINNTNPDPFAELDKFLHAFDDFIDGSNTVIGITQSDQCHSPTTQDYHAHFGKAISHIPLFAVDARNRSDVVMLVEALLSSAESAQLHNDRG